MFNVMKSVSSYICQQCGYKSATQMGKCPNCGAWNSMVETIEKEKGGVFSGETQGIFVKPQKLSEIKSQKEVRFSTGYEELDRVLGGGVVPGSVILISGDPGIGKSTLLLQMIAKTGGLYVSGEESVSQIKLRAERLGIKSDKAMLLSENDVDNIVETARGLKPSVLIVDSIQTIETSDLAGASGSVGQVRECAFRLQNVAKSLGLALFLVGHVTKEGAIAGPKVLEHLVDTVLYLEGERFHAFRVLRSVKNRFGPTDEVGVFEMRDLGMSEVKNPSDIFLEERVKNVAGSCVVCTMEGTRPVLVEVQALVVPTALAIPRRVGSGIDVGRLQLLSGVIQKRLGLPLHTTDIFVNVAGGFKLDEPAVDLAISLSIVSSFKNKPIDSKTAVFGEVGLLGEIRRVSQSEKRTKEAKKLGFLNVVSPEVCKSLSEVYKRLTSNEL